MSSVVGIVVPLLLGAISLRVGGIAFAMVTLAFAQAGQVLVQKNPNGLTGGEEGLGLNFEAIPDFFVGVLNTKNLYWLALGYAAVVFLVVRWAVNSSPGHVWQAIRENERRVEVIGLRPFGSSCSRSCSPRSSRRSAASSGCSSSARRVARR